MPGIGQIQILSPGPVARPPALAPSIGAVINQPGFKTYMPSEVIFLPGLKAILFCDGLGFQVHFKDEVGYINGPLAPPTAPTVASTGTQTRFSGNFTTMPVNNDVIEIGKPGAPGGGQVKFKTALDPADPVDQVLIGTAAVTAANLGLLLGSGTYPGATVNGVQGTNFWSYRMAQGSPTTRWAEDNDVYPFSLTASLLEWRALTNGIVGNTYLLAHVVGPGPALSFVASTAGTKSQPTSPGAGTYQHAYADYRRGDFAQTAIGPFTQTQSGDNSDMNVSGFATPPSRDNETDIRVFRSVVNGGSQFYKEADKAIPAGTFVDFYSDGQIVGDFANLYDPRLFRPYTAGYPTRFAHGTLYRDSIFGAGAHISGVYSHGVVNVVKGSLTAHFVTTNPFIIDIIGRVLRLTGFTDQYIVVDFDPTTQIATLNQPMLQASNATAAYTLTDQRSPTEIYWSSPGLYNNWPFGNSLGGVTTPDPFGVTALSAAFDGMVAFTRTGAWRIFGSPSTTFRVVPQGEGMGCFNGLCVMRVEGVVYWLGPDGIFMWSAGRDPESISTPPPTQKAKPRGIQGTIRRINIDEADGIVAVYNPSERILRWFVPLDGAAWNTHVIVYDLQTGAFTLDTCGPVTYAATVVAPGGNYVTIAGDLAGNLWQLNDGLSDGAYGFDPLRLVSGYVPGTLTVTLLTGGLPTDGSLGGVPVLSVSALDGTVQTNLIASNTGNTLTFMYPFVTDPVATDEMVLGGIEFRIQSSQYDYGVPEFLKILSTVILSFTPQDPAVQPQLWVAGGGDNTQPTVFDLRSTGNADYANLSLKAGQRVMHLRRGKYRRPQFEFLALCPGFEVEVLSLTISNPMQNEAAE